MFHNKKHGGNVFGSWLPGYFFLTVLEYFACEVAKVVAYSRQFINTYMEEVIYSQLSIAKKR